MDLDVSAEVLLDILTNFHSFVSAEEKMERSLDQVVNYNIFLTNVKPISIFFLLQFHKLLKFALRLINFLKIPLLVFIHPFRDHDSISQIVRCDGLVSQLGSKGCFR
jgi:hypothetical protein